MTVWSAEAGDASHPLIVLIHGAMDRSASMLMLSRRLDAQYRVLRYDRRGYGHSAPHPGPFDMAAQVDDLIALLDGRRAVLVGHSYGGNVAMAAAAQHAALVAGVAIYEAPLPWEQFWPGPTGGSRTDQTPADAAEAFMRRLIGDKRWLALPERTRLSRRSEGLALMGELADLRANKPWDAAQIKVPLVVGVGSRAADRYQGGMAFIADEVAGAQLIHLEGCGHNAPTTAPEQFRRELLEPLLVQLGFARD
ncbi:alpha/beta hydrolase [soil metagenome]